MTRRHKPHATFRPGDPIEGLSKYGALFAGHDFGGPLLIEAWGFNDAGGLIYFACMAARMPDPERSRRFACLHRLLLEAAGRRGFRERLALDLLLADDDTREGDIARLICGKAGRLLTPDDVQEAFRLSGWGGPLYIVPREFVLKHHQRAMRGRRGR